MSPRFVFEPDPRIKGNWICDIIIHDNGRLVEASATAETKSRAAARAVQHWIEFEQREGRTYG